MTDAHLQLDAARGSVSVARQWVAARTRAHDVPAPAAQVIELLTSELVTNAVLHASGHAIHLHVEDDGDAVTVSVRDGSAAMPVMRSTGPEVPGGHGMRLVDRLSAAWGTEATADGGKTVWFRVPHRAAPGER